MGTSRVDLQVPFAEKDAAKRLGARWDPERRLWYVPAGVDAEPLRKWIAAPESPNVRAASYFLAESTRECWRCSRETRVFAIMLPAGHAVLDVDDDPACDEWQVAEEPTVLSYIGQLADPIPERLRALAPHYRRDFSQTTGSSYWMSHCEHCGAKQGDFETIDEYDSPFSPVTPERAAQILLREIAEPFAASCGSYTCGIELFELMRRDGELSLDGLVDCQAPGQ